jgi:hypothetical protein
MPIILATKEARDQEDHNSNPPQENRHATVKKPITKKGWWNSSKYRPCVQAPIPQKKKVTKK